MRESISITTIFQIFILFVLLFTAIMCLTINNSNAFGVKDSIVNAIEALDGNYLDGADLNEEIVRVIQETSYRTSGKCPDDYDGFDRAGNSVGSNSSDAAVCIKEVDVTGGIDEALSGFAQDDFVDGKYYSVVLFFQLDIPVFKQIFNFQTKGETRIIYNTIDDINDEIKVGANDDLPDSPYDNKGNLDSREPTRGDDSRVNNPVRNPGVSSSGGGTTTQEPEEEEEETSTVSTCDFSGLGIDESLKEMGGVAFFDTNISSADGSTNLGKAMAGVKFKIQGETSDGKWAIDYNNGEICGLVDTKNMGINLKDYVPEASYNITNASSSMFRTSGEAIPGLTGMKLYSSEFNDFVPCTYSFAKVVKKAAQNAVAGGDRLVIYEAYRPNSVTTYAYPKFVSLLNSRPDLNYYVNTTFLTSNFKTSSFLAQYGSVHNRGCAVDVQLASGMDGLVMHELSVAAARYQTNNLPSVQKLTNYFLSAGAKSISSEWWHFEGTCTIYDNADIWSAV